MIRHLAPLPSSYNLAQLRASTFSRYSLAVDVNEVDDNGVRSLAVYFEEAGPSVASLTAWRAEVAAHVPTPPSALEQDRAGAPDRLRQSYSSLRTWADDAAVVAAQGANVSQAQLKALFDRFGKLADGLADLLLRLNLD